VLRTVTVVMMNVAVVAL